MQDFIDAALLKSTADRTKIAIVYGLGAFVLSRMMK